jgi:hypothetical protein
MNTRTRAVLAVILAALVGSGVFVALLPLGDACSFSDTPGVNCAVQSPLEQSFWNALAILLFVVVGAGAALAAGSRRHAVGTVASVLAILGAHFGARLAYGGETPNYELLATFVTLLASAVLGLIGGHLSGYVAPHGKRMQRTRDG